MALNVLDKQKEEEACQDSQHSTMGGERGSLSHKLTSFALVLLQGGVGGQAMSLESRLTGVSWSAAYSSHEENACLSDSLIIKVVLLSLINSKNHYETV